MAAVKKKTAATKKTSSRSKKVDARLSTEQKIAGGVVLTAAAVGALGAYFLYGSSHAKENREKARAWMLKAKGEVMEQLENAKNMSQEEYEAIVDNVTKSYVTIKSASKKEALEVAKELKNSWKNIEKIAKKEVKKPIKKK